MEAAEASKSAVLVCQGRALAHGMMARGSFSDPVAAKLLRPEELEPIEQARSDGAASDWRDRMDSETLRGSAEVMVPRTVAIDAALRERESPQVVILGAGLDGRAWRMPELASVIVFEVDHPASQADKLARLGDLRPTAREVRFVPVDFRTDSLEARLGEAGHRGDVPTTWIWEGVVPYLTKPEVAATLGSVTLRSVEGSRLIVNYQVPALSAVAGRSFARTVLWATRRPDVFAHEPHRSKWRPDEMRDLLAENRFFLIRDDDLLTVAERLEMPLKNRRSVSYGRVAVADR